MLLSKRVLEGIKHDENQTKLDRIRTYIEEQKDYVKDYTSPNRSTYTTTHEQDSDYKDNSDDLSEAFTSSISEILRRKYEKELETETKNKKIESKSVLPKSKSNGFHLLERFVSPNLEINRVTLKPNQQKKKPKVGLFNKGKSSATGKAVPDLVFSESEFLQKRKSTLTEKSIITVDTEPIEKTATITNTTSRFFKQKRASNTSIKKASITGEKELAENNNHHQEPAANHYQEPIINNYENIVNDNVSITSSVSSSYPKINQQVPLYSFMRTPDNSNRLINATIKNESNSSHSSNMIYNHHLPNWQVEDTESIDDLLVQDEIRNFWFKRKL